MATVKEKISNLIAEANYTTGCADDTLSSAVYRLINGYGGGPEIDIGTNEIHIKHETGCGFHIYLPVWNHPEFSGLDIEERAFLDDSSETTFIDTHAVARMPMIIKLNKPGYKLVPVDWTEAFSWMEELSEQSYMVVMNSSIYYIFEWEIVPR